MQLGWPYPQRRKLIDESLNASPSRSQEIEFQNRRTSLPILTVDIDFPKYRLNNGRTFDLQADHLARHPELNRDYFERDPELDVAQSVQHELLKQVLGGKNLFEYFTKHEQEEPLIIDNDGLVVNGNRRLCAMRELLSSDSERYSNFRHVDCAILPPASSEDIDELEARLQIHPDIKEPYSWTSKILMYQRRKEAHGYGEDKLAQIYEIPVTDIQELSKMFVSAQAYLNSRGKQGQIHSVSDDEFAFRQISRGREKLVSAADKELFENAAYCLIDHHTDVGGRVYEKIPQMVKSFNRIKKDLTDQFANQVSARKEVKSFASLGEILVGNDPVLEAVSDSKNSLAIKEIIVDVIEADRTIRREDKKRNAAAYLIGDASKQLEEAASRLNELGVSKLSSMSLDLDSIERSIEVIRKWLRENS